jgi:hypothetical protein
VSPATAEVYDRLWSALRTEAIDAGAHAWRLVAADRPGVHLEFLEFAGDADPRGRPAVADLLSRLEAEVGPAEQEEWTEQ